jgi:bacteriocin biosynthesis cyclodehydratase domain-containing protein
VRTAVLGVNHISLRLAEALPGAGMANVEVVDYPLLRNLRLFKSNGNVDRSKWRAPIKPISFQEWQGRSATDSVDCLVATSDFGGLRLMLEWNAFCLSRPCHFLPIVLQDMVGYVGPLVIPWETACHQCFLLRVDSNREENSLGQICEDSACEGQGVTGFHPSMASILGDIAAVELTKFYSRALPLWKVGAVLEVNLMAGLMERRNILRVPRCPSCSPLSRRGSTSIINVSLASKVITS